MRRFTVQLAARLVEHDVGSLLPDLPGTGESLLELDNLRWDDWVRAVGDLRALLPEETRLTVAIRGGALLDGSAATGARAWRLSPISGARIVAALDRTAGTSSGERGYIMSPDFRSALINAIPTPTNARTIRLLNEPGEADERFDG
ncbi:MAG TPA: hypothetical protein VF636_04965, partial [Sphingomonas sp.]